MFKNLFGKKSESAAQPFITIVSGLPRSGTSMMMKMLEAGGIPPMTDQIRTADNDNPNGYYEYERVKQLDKGDTAWVPEARGKAVKVISVLLPYLPPQYEYRVIFQYRHLNEIIASQRKMLVNRGEDPDKVDDAQMIALFEKHLGQIENWLRQQPNMRTLFVHYSDILADPSRLSIKINEFMDFKLDTARMVQVVDEKLYRNRGVPVA